MRSFSLFLLYDTLLNKILKNPKRLVIGCSSGTRNLTRSYEDVLTPDIVSLKGEQFLTGCL